MSLLEEQLEEIRKKTASVGVTPEMVSASPVGSGLLGVKAPQHWTQEAMERDGKGKFFGKMLLGGFTGLTPLLFPEMIGAKARYETDLALYQKAQEMAMMDPQVEELASYYEANGQPLLAMQIRASNSIKDVDLNPRMLGTNQSLVSATGDTIAQGFQDPLANQPAAVRQAVFVSQNPEMKPEVERQGKIIKDVQNAGDIANATQGGSNDANTYRDQANYYIDAIRNDRVIADRIDVLDQGLAMFDENSEGGAVDTGFITGALFNMFGIGDEDQGRLSQMGISEAMEELANFKGPTTDFEFEKSELKAFASIMRGEDVNRGTLKSARDGLKRMRKRNALNAQSALSLATDRDTGGNRIPSLTKAYPQSQYMIDLFSEADQSQNPAGVAAMPKVGAVIDGYRFKGGNPNDQASWEPVQ